MKNVALCLVFFTHSAVKGGRGKTNRQSRLTGFHSAEYKLVCVLDAKTVAVIYNTAPAPVLDRKTLAKCLGTLKIDLASLQGLDGPDVIWARGLPGLYAPESSGRLIAQSILPRLLNP